MNLYAWTDNDFTIYTNTETPTTSDNLYNADGEITTSLEENYGDAYIWSVSGDSIAVHFTHVRAVREFTRDPSKDILEPTPQYISNLSDGTNTYVIKDAEARTALSSKQDTLESGTNIKTINGTSLLGSGNIEIQSGADVEAYTATEVQTLWGSI